MTRPAFRFDRFRLDPDDRQLRRDEMPVELNARYLDALVLLVSEPGRLISKARFLDEVWHGVPVTDEALTQCIKTLRRQLGDDATRPRFIETVPKHGYRFIAPVVRVGGDTAPTPPQARPQDATAGAADRQTFVRLGLAGMIGGGLAGLIGGLVYGVVGITDPLQAGGGSVSALLVIMCLTGLVGLTGGAGVGFGIAASVFAPRRRGVWTVVGGAAGGMAVGAVVKLVGLDAFNLLFGQSPQTITGAPEGAVLGAAVGLGVWIATRQGGSLSRRRRVAVGGLIAAAAGALIPLLGGRLLGGSLAGLADGFPDSRLRLDPLGGLFGESDFGLVSQIVTGGLEGLLFGSCVVAAMMITRNRSGDLMSSPAASCAPSGVSVPRPWPWR